MKSVRSLVLVFGFVAVAAVLGGCGPGGPEAMPEKSTTLITEEVPRVEGVDPKPTKGVKAAPGPAQHP